MIVRASDPPGLHNPLVATRSLLFLDVAMLELRNSGILRRIRLSIWFARIGHVCVADSSRILCLIRALLAMHADASKAKKAM